MSQGVWQSFAVPLGEAVSISQIAVLDYQLGASLRTKRTVNDRFADECGYSTTMAAPRRTMAQGRQQACIAFVLDNSNSIAANVFRQVRSF